MDAASIEEINKLRKSMGMKPLPVPGAEPSNQNQTPGDDAPSTLATREAEAYDNFRKVREAEESRRRREQKAAAVKKARELAQRSAVLEGKGLAELDNVELDTKAWLKNQKKRQKEIEKARKMEEEQAAAEAAAAAAVQYTSKDLAGLKVAHDVSNFLDGDEQVLTLKDTNVLDEEASADELENQDLREREKLKERMELKRKKPVYDPTEIDETGERGILSHYDEEIQGKKKKLFKLDVQGTTAELADILDAPAQRKKVENLDVEVLEDKPTSDYLDISEVKVKKPKKKKSKATRHRPLDDDDVLAPVDEPATPGEQLMDVDSVAGTFNKKKKVNDESYVDDDDLQSSLAIQRRDALKKRKKMRPEDIAKQLREEALEEAAAGPEERGSGIVLDEITGFVDTLQKPSEDERRKPRQKSEVDQKNTSMDADSSDGEDTQMRDTPTGVKQESPDREPNALPELTTTGVEEEEAVEQGMGATLKLLRNRGLIKDQHGGELNERIRKRELFLAELHRRMAKFDEEARLQRERDRASGRLDRMSAREREEWQRQQNAMRDQHQARVMDQLYKEGYQPNVELKYVDEYGRNLDQKEAFKHLSHQFHGKGSGKGKTDKRLKKIEEEKRREAQSMLDASQNVGMSSAAAQQIKKRREAGVRLA
ncbi:hypothetical protein VTK73DRAFT_4801 [Phialemonium thermophilum]|uniref:SART-1 protein n=1 Tax=Phialemonium thermophilum TaxID=223376 RepID=A0ABR3XYT7_9PEZI